VSSIEVLPDPVRGWLARKENQKPEGARFWPATDQQGAALDCDADILLLGGSAGSLKTSTILADLIQERDYPRMNSYCFRKTYPELEDVMQQAMDLFPQTGARSRDDGREYVWPSGAHFRFRHLSHEKNLYENQGKAMTAIGVDESTHLLELSTSDITSASKRRRAGRPPRKSIPRTTSPIPRPHLPRSLGTCRALGASPTLMIASKGGLPYASQDRR
jgi:hypothetical protein